MQRKPRTAYEKFLQVNGRLTKGDYIDPTRNISGRARFHRVSPISGWGPPLSEWISNTVMYDWATIFANLLLGSSQFKIAGMYLEFENVSNPAIPVTIPAYDRSGGIAYYDGLASSSSVDYLRVPLAGGLLSGSSNAGFFPGGNIVNFAAQSQGSVGVNGKPFSSTANSVVYGGALVAIPDLADRTQDLVLSRWYPPQNQQQEKLASVQIGLSWQLTAQ